MEIKEQIQILSETPIFFMSPNIGIKFEIIKDSPKIINNKFLKIFDLVKENRNYYSKEFDSSYVVYLMISYLNKQMIDMTKITNIEILLEELPPNDAFYLNAFLAFYYYDNNNYEKCESNIKHALKFVESNNVPDYEKMCIYALTADFLSKTQDIFLSGAEKYFIQALNLVKDTDALAKISILNSLAYYYHNMEKRDRAIKYINIALDMVKENNYGISSFTTYKNAGIIYTTIGDFEKAKDNFTKATTISTKLIDNTEENVKLLNTLGYVEFLKGDFLDSLDSFEKALTMLLKYNNATKLLDEAVKTFDNLGNILKFLGDIDGSINFQLLGKEILENVNLVNRVNEVHNLSKTYTDIALTYLVYKSDNVLATKYFDLAMVKTDKNEHYIKRNKKIILESLIDLSRGITKEKEVSFYMGIEQLKESGGDNLYVQLILIEFLIYYYKLREDESLLRNAKSIAKEHKLMKHYEALYSLNMGKKLVENLPDTFAKYPLNLIKLLSSEKKDLLIENRKSKHLELIEEFVIDISKTDKEISLFSECERILNKHFFSRGFLVIEKQDSNYDIKYCSENNEKFVKTNEKFIIDTIKTSKTEKILSFGENDKIKSIMIEKIEYLEDNSTYYFVLFTDEINDWNFSFEDSKTFNILASNIYLKHRNIKQLKKIELNSITDYMTGFKNASYYNQAINILANNYNVTGEQFLLAIIDLNKFKEINDKYGHDIGDKTLKYFSQNTEKILKGVFDFVRYGGDEFILFCHANIDMEKEFESLRTFFENHPIIVNEDEKIFVEFSYGIELYSGQGESEIFKSADNKMYKQKILSKK